MAEGLNTLGVDGDSGFEMLVEILLIYFRIVVYMIYYGLRSSWCTISLWFVIAA